MQARQIAQESSIEADARVEQIRKEAEERIARTEAESDERLARAQAEIEGTFSTRRPSVCTENPSPQAAARACAW